MKKFLFATALILGIFVSQFVLVPQAEAAEVYAVTETQPRTGELIDYYVVTDGIQETSYVFKVRIHAVGKNSRRNKYAEFGYKKKMENGTLSGCPVPTLPRYRMLIALCQERFSRKSQRL